jgi:hypothetical protein
MGEASSSSPLISLLAGAIVGLCTAFIAPFITSFLSERSRKLDLYKTVYPEKFKAASEAMKKMSDLHRAVVTKRDTADPRALRVQATEFVLMANAYDWLLGDAYQKATIEFYEICEELLAEKDPSDITALETRLYEAGQTFSRVLRAQVHLPQFEGLYPPAHDGPLSGRSSRAINLLLLFLIALDAGLSMVALAFPYLWFQLIHGEPYSDPQGLLRRTGAVWAAFTLLQGIAYVKWRVQPYWLVVVAGVRLTELFSDWTYAYFAQQVTWAGRIGLLLAPPANLACGWFLITRFLHRARGH